MSLKKKKNKGKNPMSLQATELVPSTGKQDHSSPSSFKKYTQAVFYNMNHSGLWSAQTMQLFRKVKPLCFQTAFFTHYPKTSKHCNLLLRGNSKDRFTEKEELDINCAEPVFLTDKKNNYLKLYINTKLYLSLKCQLYGLYHHQIFENVCLRVSRWYGMKQNKY